MEQDNRSRMNTPGKLFYRLLTAGLLVLYPVHMGKAPENRGISQFLGHPQIGFIAFSLGREYMARSVPVISWKSVATSSISFLKASLSEIEGISR